VSFLNVGPWELTLILIIAILLIGPRRMVEVARMIGYVTGQLRKLSNEFTATLQAEILTAERETGQTPQKSIIEDAIEPIVSIQTELQAIGRETRLALANIVESEAEPIVNVQTELQAAERETRLALENGAQDDPGQKTG